MSYHQGYEDGFGDQHHRQSASVVFTPPASYNGYFRRAIQSCCIVLVLVVLGLLAGVFVGLGFAIYSSHVSIDSNTAVYSPGDTRLYNYSSTFFCMGGAIEYKSSPTHQNPNPPDTSLYLLSSKPPIKHTNSFYVNKTSFKVPDGGWDYWSFYLYPGSRLAATACQFGSEGYFLYLIKGSNNYKLWTVEQYAHYNSTREIINCYPNTFEPFTKDLVYEVDEEDRYYVVLQNTLISTYTWVYISVNQTGYVPDGAPNCTGAHGCTYYTTDNRIKYALVTTSKPRDGDWSKNVTLRYSCVVNVANYVLITVVPFIALVVLCVAMVVIISVTVRVIKRRKRAAIRYETLATDDREALESSLPAMTVQPSKPNPSVNPGESAFENPASPPPYYQ